MELSDLLPSSPPSLVGGVPMYLSGEDALRLTAFNALAAVTLTFSGRFLPVPRDDEPHPRPLPFSHTLTPATDRTASVLTRGLGEGWLLEASVLATAATPQLGQCFAVLTIVRGLGSSALELSTLAQGYVTSKQRLVWPGGFFTASLDGGGALRVITGTQPGAGAEVSETVPTGARWELLSARVLLVASAAVANRLPEWTVDDGTNIVFESGGSQAVTATTTFAILLAQLGSAFLAGGIGLAVFPAVIGLKLAAGFRIKTNTAAIQGADQYGIPRLLVREWIEGA